MRTSSLFLVLALALLAACSGPKRGEGPVTSIGSKAERELVRVYLDAGHGGQDFGTHSLDQPVYHEKNLTLSTTLMLKNHLQKMGYQVILSRKNDVFIPLNKRVEDAHNHKADVFVSIHYNSAPKRGAHGVEVYYYEAKHEQTRTQHSQRLAQRVIDNIIKSTHQNSRGIKAGNFAVIRETKIPAILVEAGFVTNEAEIARIVNPRYQNRIAWGVAGGIDDFFFGR